ncbi:MAG: hypothetical protein HFJ45_01630 [Clostridia bacterium]|nr:hypothetical protein [Clostridia bacterium]
MRSRFFNSEIIGYDAENMPVFDRAEEASFFAKYFSQFISNGVFPNPSTNMQVLVKNGMQIKVSTGVCYIDGYMGWVENEEVFEIEESDIQPRIDRIVARLNLEDRSINLFVKKGIASANPIVPDLQRDYDIYELALADVRINANVIEIKQENITDLRLNTEVCGIVANQLQHVDTTTLFNQYKDWLNRVTEEGEINLNQKQEEFENNFNNWFERVKTTLSGDVAGNLLNLIETKLDKDSENYIKSINISNDKGTKTTATILTGNGTNITQEVIGIPSCDNNASYQLGYTYQETQCLSVNDKKYLNPGEYSLLINVNTQGLPTRIVEDRRIILKTLMTQSSYENFDENLEDNFIRQDLYYNNNGKHWRRFIEFIDVDNINYGSWREIKEEEKSMLVAFNSAAERPTSDIISNRSSVVIDTVAVNKGNKFSVVPGHIIVNDDVELALFILNFRFTEFTVSRNYGFRILVYRNGEVAKFTEITQSLDRAWDSLKFSYIFDDLKKGDDIQIKWYQGAEGIVLVSGNGGSSFVSICEL